jgi:hypothetical protein
VTSPVPRRFRATSRVIFLGPDAAAVVTVAALGHLDLVVAALVVAGAVGVPVGWWLGGRRRPRRPPGAAGAAHATDLDMNARRVMLHGGAAVRFDTLVIVTGSSPRTVPGLGAACRPSARVGVVGGGFIGSEVAWTLHIPEAAGDHGGTTVPRPGAPRGGASWRMSAEDAAAVAEVAKVLDHRGTGGRSGDGRPRLSGLPRGDEVPDDRVDIGLPA